MKKTFLMIVIILIGLLVLIGLVRQIIAALQSGERMDRLLDEVGLLQAENKRLQDELVEVQQLDFIEEIARNKLNLARPDETIMIIPQEIIDKVLSLSKPVEEPALPNWQAWLKLFLRELKR